MTEQTSFWQIIFISDYPQSPENVEAEITEPAADVQYSLGKESIGSKTRNNVDIDIFLAIIF